MPRRRHCPPSVMQNEIHRRHRSCLPTCEPDIASPFFLLFWGPSLLDPGTEEAASRWLGKGGEKSTTKERGWAPTPPEPGWWGRSDLWVTIHDGVTSAALGGEASARHTGSGLDSGPLDSLEASRRGS